MIYVEGNHRGLQAILMVLGGRNKLLARNSKHTVFLEYGKGSKS